MCLMNSQLLAIYLLQMIPDISELLPEKDRSSALLTADTKGHIAQHLDALKRAGVSIH